jgi:hypothetical protein
MKTIRERLQELYHDASKHSSYQNVPEFVSRELGYTETIDEEWRGDTARYGYILEELKLSPGAVLGDVGANTGFFTLSLGHSFKDSSIIAYESNTNHVEYMQLIAEYFGLDNIHIEKLLIDLDGLDRLRCHDVILHLNVLHHAGHDFDCNLVHTVKDFETYALEYLTKLNAKASRLFFQMGSNWGGNRVTPIIPKENDYGKVILISRLLLGGGWKIIKIALATKDPAGTTVYRNLPVDVVDMIRDGVSPERVPQLENCIREFGLDQFKGEFYRRPIFVCDSG